MSIVWRKRFIRPTFELKITTVKMVNLIGLSGSNLVAIFNYRFDRVLQSTQNFRFRRELWGRKLTRHSIHFVACLHSCHDLVTIDVETSDSGGVSVKDVS